MQHLGASSGLHEGHQCTCRTRHISGTSSGSRRKLMERLHACGSELHASHRRSWRATSGTPFNLMYAGSSSLQFLMSHRPGTLCPMVCSTLVGACSKSAPVCCPGGFQSAPTSCESLCRNIFLDSYVQSKLIIGSGSTGKSGNDVSDRLSMGFDGRAGRRMRRWLRRQLPGISRQPGWWWTWTLSSPAWKSCTSRRWCCSDPLCLMPAVLGQLLQHSQESEACLQGGHLDLG